MSRNERFIEAARVMGHDFSGEIKVGGHYVPLVVHAGLAYLSGQIPRVGDTVVGVGAAGAEASLDEARTAARVCTMRALALLQKSLGSLDRIERVLRLTAYVRSAPGFTQQSEVADAASDLLAQILGDVEGGAHVRTSVGVLQLPKGATVEIDLVAAVREP